MQKFNISRILTELDDLREESRTSTPLAVEVDETSLRNRRGLECVRWAIARRGPRDCPVGFCQGIDYIMHVAQYAKQLALRRILREWLIDEPAA